MVNTDIFWIPQPVRIHPNTPVYTNSFGVRVNRKQSKCSDCYKPRKGLSQPSKTRRY